MILSTSQLIRPTGGWLWLTAVVGLALAVAIVIELLDRRDAGQRQIDALARGRRR